MNKIKQILIGAGMIALSGNVAAMKITVVGTEYTNFKSLLPVVEDFVSGAIVTDLSDKQIGKLSRQVDKFSLKKATAGVSAKKHKKIMKKKLRKWDVAALSGSGLNVETSGGGECDALDCNHNVPEPSTIALLGLGLVGIGAARRLRKKTR